MSQNGQVNYSFEFVKLFPINEFEFENLGSITEDCKEDLKNMSSNQ